MDRTTRYVTGDELPGAGLPLSAEHRRELFIDSAIAPQVAGERGYTTMERIETPESAREQLARMGFPAWATREGYFYPGLHIPQYTPSGERYAGQWKPRNAVPNREGKRMKYASARGAARLDVHPRWSRGGTIVPIIQDASIRLWITEGVKKADALTSRGECTVALAGVFNWRNTHASLGDWEDVALKGREVVICFDADAITKPAVAQAMARLGAWLKHKGAARIHYLVVPAMVGDSACKGVDDFLAAGGSVKELEQAFDPRPPRLTDTDDRFTDARLAETLAMEVLDGAYVWAKGLEWLTFTGTVWREVTEVTTTESVRQWALDHFQAAAGRLKLDDRDAAGEVEGWRTMLSRNRATTVLAFSRGQVELSPDAFDADADHLNTASGYLSLESGEVRPVSADEYPTRVTGATFQPDATSAVWDRFLERILPDPAVRSYVQRLLGYALLGEVREHVMPIFVGEGANGKGTLRDALLAAFGDYALEVDPEILMASHNPRHGTFLLELRGRRLVFCSETEKGRAFADAMMRRLVGGDPIQGNRMRQDPITFMPSHTLIMCTNHLPRVQNDEANWRRIQVVPFDVVIPEGERDGRLPRRLQQPDVSAAVLAWAYRGYQDYAVQGLNPPDAVRLRTGAYRHDSDLTGRFLEETLEAAPGRKVLGKDLYERYVTWFRAEGGRDDVPLGRSEMGRELAKRGVASSLSKGVTWYRGVAFTGAEQDE